MKKTAWFPGDVKPVRVGVYQQKDWTGRRIGYQRWDGFDWFAWYTDADRAILSLTKTDAGYQNDPWRGLASDPKGK